MDMDLRDKKVLVAGTGISGIGAAGLLLRVGACPILFDSNEELKEEDIRKRAGDLGEVPIVLGSVPDSLADQLALAAVSPGVPSDAPFLQGLRERGIPIWGEIELGYAFGRGSVVAITGTNGKTTTTTLTGEIMKAFYSSVFVVGNIGKPYTQASLLTQEDSVVVAEISSFQLETVCSFAPKVSAILNITPDHLNRHHTMECYVSVKESIAARQTKDDVCVLNYEDPYTRSFGERCPARVFYFSSARELEEGIYLKGDEIWLSMEGRKEKLLHTGEIRLVGICNVENVMAAIGISLAMKVPMDVILDTVRSFRAVEHRIEFVDTKGGVDFYNDSKGTNPDAAIQGIRAMTKPTVLIGGGYDKGSAYDEWIEAFEGKVKALVLIGQTREKIAQCAREHGVGNIILADTFEEAFEICKEQAQPGDAVLLSPACASWGMFPNYEARGRLFKELVKKMGAKE